MADTASCPPYSNRGLGLLAEEISLTFLALVTTIARVGIRLYNRQARWDDFTITLAMAFRLVSFTFTMLSIAAGNGKHACYLTKPQMSTIMKWTWGNEVLIFTVTCIVKIAIILHIFRIKKSGWLKWLLYAAMVGLVVTNLACVIILFAQCQPLSAFWNPGTGTCWSQNIYNTFIYVSVGYAILSDLLCTAMPIIILWRVRITTKQKIGICGLMFIGLVASACAAVRGYLSSLQQGTDLSYNLVTTDEWAFAEANVGIIGANLALGSMMWIFFKSRIAKFHTRKAAKQATQQASQQASQPAPKAPTKASRTPWQRWLHRNGSESTLCDTDDSMAAKDKEEENHSDSAGTHSQQTATTATTATAPSSRDSTFPEEFSNIPNTITQTVSYSVASVRYDPGSGLSPQQAPPRWLERFASAEPPEWS